MIRYELNKFSCLFDKLFEIKNPTYDIQSMLQIVNDMLEFVHIHHMTFHKFCLIIRLFLSHYISHVN